MSNSTILSVNTLLNKAVKSMNFMSLGQEKKQQTADINESVELADIEGLSLPDASDDSNDTCSSISLICCTTR